MIDTAMMFPPNLVDDDEPVAERVKPPWETHIFGPGPCGPMSFEYPDGSVRHYVEGKLVRPNDARNSIGPDHKLKTVDGDRSELDELGHLRTNSFVKSRPSGVKGGAPAIYPAVGARHMSPASSATSHVNCPRTARVAAGLARVRLYGSCREQTHKMREKTRQIRNLIRINRR